MKVALGLITGFIVAMLMLPSAAVEPYTPPVEQSTPTEEQAEEPQQLIDTKYLSSLVNNYRESNGLQPLTPSKKLSQTAQKKCDQMVKHNYFTHYNPNGVYTPTHLLGLFPAATRASENLAEGYTSEQSVLNAWKSSPSHNEALLSTHTHVGYGVCDTYNFKNKNIYNIMVVQHFFQR